jgi:hypothetical protein
MFIEDVRAQDSATHPHALFSLTSDNNSPEAKAIIENNHHLVSNRNSVEYGINNIGFYISNKSSGPLASIGRDSDIIISVPTFQEAGRWKKVSRIQCFFEMHPDSKAVLLYGRQH